jgi:uncharacterized membrane protein YeiH
MAGIEARLDLFGVLVLSFVTALGGGIVRDLLIGAAPPAAIRDWRYATIAFSGGALAFLLYQVVRQVPHPVLMALDAAGLALFAVAGTAKALDFHLNALSVALMGTITGAGGGVVRDIFLVQVPAVLQVEIYATAALAGSLLMTDATSIRPCGVTAAGWLSTDGPRRIVRSGERGQKVKLTPNPRLQRTRVRAPLSRRPLGDPEPWR